MDETLIGNLSVHFDMTQFLQTLYSDYLKNSDCWMTVILSLENAYMTFPLEDELTLANVPDVVEKIEQQQNSGYTLGVIGGQNEQYDVISYFRKLSFSGHYLGIIVSNDISGILHSTRMFFIIFCLIAILLTSACILVLHFHNFDLKRTVREQHAQLELLETILQDVPVGMILFKDNKLITTNELALDLLSDFIQPTDIGNPYSTIEFPPHFLNRADNEDIDEWSIFSFEKFGGEIHLLKNQSDMRIHNEKYTIIVFSNITEMEKSRRNAVRSELTKSELLSRISRDFKRPLDSINDALALLIQQYPGDATLHHITGLVKFIADSMTNMQDFGDVEAGNVILDELPFDMNEAVEDVVDKYRKEIARKGIKLTLNVIPTSFRQIVGDAVRIKQILNQLLSNAVKFTEEGEIRISVETMLVEDNKMLIRCSVEDTGKGMSVEQLKNLFSLDTRAKSGDSMGLGTIIAKQLVNIMGGNILVSSPSPISRNSLTPGTKFFFTIRCDMDVICHKELDFSSVVSYEQLGVLIIATDEHSIKSQLNYLQRQSINPDVYLYDKDVNGILLANKLIIDRNRYQLIIIATNDSQTGFTIAEALCEKGLTKRFLFAFIDNYEQRGNYLRAKTLQMDYYLDNKTEDLAALNTILIENFPHLSRSEKDGEEIRKDLRILVCDNDTLSQTVTRLIFNTLGYNIDCVNNFEELKTCISNRTYDVLFMDIKFPPANATEVVRKLRNQGNKIPIIAITSMITKENIRKLSHVGISGYIQKPVETETIRQILYKWFV
jgi:signal transduction histidine kinase/CheY-like chemotaxis protein